MSLTIKTPPDGLKPFTLAEAKAHLRVDDSDSDSLIASQIGQARSEAEAFLAATIIETVYLYTLDGFPREIILPTGPVFTDGVVAITYVDSAGDTQTLAVADYQVSYGEVCRIRPAYSKTWPATRPQMDAVTVEYKAGWADSADVPAAIKSAVAMILGHLYEHRQLSEMPTGAWQRLMPFTRFA